MPQERDEHTLAPIHRRRQAPLVVRRARRFHRQAAELSAKRSPPSLLFKKWIHAELRRSRAPSDFCFPSSVGGALANLGVTLAGKTAVNLNFTAGDEGTMRTPSRTCGDRNHSVLARVPGEGQAARTARHGFSRRPARRRSRPASKALAMAAARLLPARTWQAREAGRSGRGHLLQRQHRHAQRRDAVALEPDRERRRHRAGLFRRSHAIACSACCRSFTLSATPTRSGSRCCNGFKAVFHPNPTDAKAIGELAGAHHPTLFLSTPDVLPRLPAQVHARAAWQHSLSAGRRGKAAARAGEVVRREVRRDAAGRLRLHGNGTGGFGQRRRSRARRRIKPGTVGRPLPYVSLRIVDPDTLAPLAAGETGLLLVNGPSRMLGYLGDAERTAQSLRGSATTSPAIWRASMPTASCTSSIVCRASARSRARWCRI